MNTTLSFIETAAINQTPDPDMGLPNDIYQFRKFVQKKQQVMH